LTVGAARAFSLAAGTLLRGAAADVVAFDPAAPFVVEPARFRSKSRNSPFGGWALRGRVALTIVDGKIVYEAGGPA